MAIVALAAMPAAAIAGGEHKDKHKHNAAQACRAERGDTDASREAFAKKYGTAKSGYRNAFGKCVSKHSRHRHKHHRCHKRTDAPGKPS